jgi:hypothetical protein
VGVRPEVPVALLLRLAGHHCPRPLLIQGDREEGVRLVVLQPHVEPRLVALDQVVLEEECLDLVAHLDPLDVIRRLDHLAGTGLQRVRFGEVVREARPQVLRLAHVEDAPLRIDELVRTRRVRDRLRGAFHPAIVSRAGTAGWSIAKRSVHRLRTSEPTGCPRCTESRYALWRPAWISGHTYRFRSRQPRGWRPGCPRRLFTEPAPSGGIP